MFKSYDFINPKNYHRNLSKEYGKKKRPLSKNSNNINVLYNNIKSNYKINNFPNVFFPFNNKKKELLDNKLLKKDKFINQSNKDDGKKVKYFLKSNEKKSEKNELNLFNIKSNKMPIKMFEFEEKEKNNIFEHKNIENKIRLKSGDLGQKIEKQKNYKNNYISNKNLNINGLMIKEPINVNKNDIFGEIIEFKENKIKKIPANLKIFENYKFEIIADDKNSKNLIEIEKELKRRECEIEEREKEFNNKINFLEDKENMLENELKAQENLKIENIYLNQKNKELEKEIKDANIQIQKLMNTNNEENTNFRQENSQLKQRIKELEEEIANLKDNNSKQKKFKLKDILIFYKKPTLIGLDNIGATCFMNSTLQCLSQTKALTNYFLINKEKINDIKIKAKSEYQLSPVYLELIQKLWDKNGSKSFSPNKFMNTIEKMNPLFKTGQAGYAKDFIIFILEQLHKELKKPVNNSNNINNNVLNQYDKQNALNFFFNQFKKECSIISDIFFGFNETTNECLNCKQQYNLKGLNNPICYNYGIFNCIIFPLEEVKNMKNNLNNNNIQINNNEVSLYDCFFFNQKNDYFTGENRNYCNICKQLFDSIHTSKIFISPNVLVIILNRGRGNIYDVKLNFSEEIDITQFVLQKDCPQLIYNLYGVITHIGQSGPNAHFVASCKSPIDNQWYRYNDSFVNLITNIEKEIINFGVPYILFYQKNIDKKI